MTTEADEAAFAHWYEAAQTAQREVARLTAERDKWLNEVTSSWDALGDFRGLGTMDGMTLSTAVRAKVDLMARERDEALSNERALRESLTMLHSQRDEALRELDAERREKTHRFALRRELEEALGVGDSYADGVFEAALARIDVLKTAEADRDRLRRELAEALAGREREYARAEAEHDAAARIASEWAASSYDHLEPCPLCWGPMDAELAETCMACVVDGAAKGGAT